MLKTLTKYETYHLIEGPDGKLELVLAEPTAPKINVLGIVCHPHSLHGGTMYNKVVTTVGKTFQDLGVTTIRFNFRGVGQSEGTFDQGRGEVFDLLTVINWMLDAQPHLTIWLAGFSFGAYVAAKAATQIPVAKLVTIAPPVTHFPMQSLPPITSPWILVQGGKDEIVNAKDVIDWAEARDPKPTILQLPEASHFFHGQLGELRRQLEVVLSN